MIAFCAAASSVAVAVRRFCAAASSVPAIVNRACAAAVSDVVASNPALLCECLQTRRDGVGDDGPVDDERRGLRVGIENRAVILDDPKLDIVFVGDVRANGLER